MRIILLLLISGWLTLGAQARWDGTLLPDEQLTVARAIAIAISQNPALNQYREEIRSQRGERWRGVGLPSPDLLILQEGIPREGSGFGERRWGISQSLDFPLKSYFRMRRMTAEVGAMERSLEMQAIELTARVKKVYTELAHAAKLQELRQDELDIARELHHSVSARVEAGEASELDLMQADIQLAEAQNDLDGARRIYHQNRYQLFNLIGLPLSRQKYTLQFPDTLGYFPVEIDQHRALERLPELPVSRSAAVRQSAARWGVREAWSGFLPDLRLSYYRQDFGSGYDFYGVEAGIKLPLWFWFNQNGDIQAAKAQRRAAGHERRAIESDLKRQIEDAWHGFEQSRAVIQRYQQTIRRQSEQLLTLTMEGYRLGELDLLKLLESQRTFLTSQERYYVALRDYYIQLIELEKFLDHEIVFRREGDGK